MTDLQDAQTADLLHFGTVVAPAEDLLSVQSPEGDQIPVRNLGLGIIDEVDPAGKVLVRWVAAQFSVWMRPQDLRLFPNTHVLSLYSRSRDGRMALLSRKLVSQMGLENNWTVELLPDEVIRAVRADGQAWTFGYSWVDDRIKVWWPQPPRDEDAEAFVAADLAVARDHEV
jgi:hypothetical protein